MLNMKTKQNTNIPRDLLLTFYFMNPAQQLRTTDTFLYSLEGATNMNLSQPPAKKFSIYGKNPWTSFPKYKLNL